MRGYPDDGNPFVNVGQVSSDNLELAARLGSVARYVRTGNMLYQQQFIDGNDIWRLTAGTGCTVTVSGAKPYERSNALKLSKPLGAAGGASFDGYIPLTDTTKIGVEIMLAAITATPVSDVCEPTFTLSISDSGAIYDNRLFLDLQNNHISFNDYSSGSLVKRDILTNMASMASGFNFTIYNYLKFIFDLENGIPDRLFINDYLVNMRSYRCNHYHSGSNSYVYLAVGNLTTNVALDLYATNIGITINEP